MRLGRRTRWVLIAPLAILMLMSLLACAHDDPLPLAADIPNPTPTPAPVPASSPTPVLTADPTPRVIAQPTPTRSAQTVTPTPASTSTLPSTEPPAPAQQAMDDKAASATSLRDVSDIGLLRGSGVAAYHEYNNSPSVEDMLSGGLHAAGVTPSHIALRGTVNAGSIRCDWRGSARTLGQREAAIRFWLGIDDSDPLPSVSEAETQFMSHVNQMASRYRDSMKARYLPIARGGLSTDHLVLTCYADYSVSEYILGSGAARSTVAYDRMGEAQSYDLYQPRIRCRRVWTANHWTPDDRIGLRDRLGQPRKGSRINIDRHPGKS